MSQTKNRTDESVLSTGGMGEVPQASIDILIRAVCSIIHSVSVSADSHEAVFSLALLQSVFNEAAQFQEEQLLRRFGCCARSFGLTILFTQHLSAGVTWTETPQKCGVLFPWPGLE